MRRFGHARLRQKRHPFPLWMESGLQLLIYDIREKYAKVMPIGRILDILVDRVQGRCYSFLGENRTAV